MKTTLAIIITLALAATSANSLLASANTTELSSTEFSSERDQARQEGAFRPMSHAPRS